MPDSPECPRCGSGTFIDSHTPCSDEPELTTDRFACRNMNCDWFSDEWPHGDEAGVYVMRAIKAEQAAPLTDAEKLKAIEGCYFAGELLQVDVEAILNAPSAEPSPQKTVDLIKQGIEQVAAETGLPPNTIAAGGRKLYLVDPEVWGVIAEIGTSNSLIGVGVRRRVTCADSLYDKAKWRDSVDALVFDRDLFLEKFGIDLKAGERVRRLMVLLPIPEDENG